MPEKRTGALLAQTGFAKVGLDGKFLTVDPALERLLDHDAKTLARLRFQDITHPDDLLRDEANLEQVLSKGRGSYSMMKRYIRSDGGLFWAELDVTLVRGGDDAPSGFISKIRSLNVDHDTLNDIHNRASRDPLTQLFNRATLDEQLMAWVLKARRRDLGFAVIMLDLDGFKSINDGFGHAAGDALLERFAARLNAVLAPGDIATRAGGDEFVVLVPDMHSDMAVQKKIRALGSNLARPFNLLDGDIHVGVSSGFALYPQHGDSPSQLMKHADMAMYDHKQRSKGNIRRLHR